MIRGGPTFCLLKQLNTPKKDKPICLGVSEKMKTVWWTSFRTKINEGAPHLMLQPYGQIPLQNQSILNYTIFLVETQFKEVKRMGWLQKYD